MLCLHFPVKIIFFIFGYFLPLILIVILYSVMIFKLLKQVGRKVGHLNVLLTNILVLYVLFSLVADITVWHQYTGDTN